MKKIIATVLVIIAIIVMITKLQRYTIKATVVEDRGSTIVVEDKAGYLWKVDVEAFVYQEGDTVTLVMNDKSTTSRIDDEVIDIR